MVSIATQTTKASMADSRSRVNFDCEDPRALGQQATWETEAEQSRCRKYIRLCSTNAALAGAVKIVFLALGFLVQHAPLESAMPTHGQKIAKGAFLLQPASPMLARTQRVPQLTLNTRSPSIPSISRVSASSGRPMFPSFDFRRPYTVPSRAVMPSMSSVTEDNSEGGSKETTENELSELGNIGSNPANKPALEGPSKWLAKLRNLKVKVRFWGEDASDEEVGNDIKEFLLFLAIFLLLRTFVCDTRYIPSLSMFPTYEVGDQFFLDKISKRWRDVERRDIITFNPPQPAFYEATGKRGAVDLIKRVVAVEGDVVEVKDDGRLYINGVKQDEPFTNELAEYSFGPRTVPEGNVFVLGDNRNLSADGHIWGFLPKENIIGRASFRYWPPQRMGAVQIFPK